MSDIQKHRLQNGITVLLQEVPHSELSCVMTWVKAGYFDEPDELTGISHVLEHMFFKGTRKRGVGRIAQETKELGGYLNAGTIYEYTNYYVVVPSENTLSALDIQADALINSVFDEEEYQKEKAVICQEIKRKFDNSHALAFEKLLERSYRDHPIRRWRIGTEEQVMGFSRAQLVDYYSKYYVPHNIIVVVCGGFDSKVMLSEIEKRYAAIPSQVSPIRKVLTESGATKEHLLRIKGDVSRPLIKMGFHAPKLYDDMYYPTIVLSLLLGKGRSSRLALALKEKMALVDHISCSYNSFQSTGFFSIDAEASEDMITKCEVEIWNEITKLSDFPPTEAEIQKVAHLVEGNFYRDKEDVMGQASSLAYYEHFGGFEKLNEYTQKIREVTSSEVVRAARELFRFENMGIVEYVPMATKEGASDQERLSQLKLQTQDRIALFHSGTLSASPKKEASHLPDQISSLPVSKEPQLEKIGSSGTYIWFRNSKLPLVSMSLQFPNGRLFESEDQRGLTAFSLKNTLKGTQNRSASDIAFELESLGAGLSFDASADHFGYNLHTLSKDFEKGLEVLSDMILRPTFLPEEIEKEKQFTLAMIKRSRDDMFRYPVELFYRSIFGSHAYGASRIGNEDSVSRFNTDMVSKSWAQSLDWDHVVVSVAGGIDRGHAKDLIEKHLQISQRKPTAKRDLADVNLFQIDPNEQSDRRDKQQSGLVLGFKGMSCYDERFASLEVMRNILSGMGGRLFTNIREKHSLAYTVAAMNLSLMNGGAFFCYAGFSPEKESEVKKRMLDELQNICESYVTDAELITSKAYTKGSYLMGMQGTAAYASHFADIQSTRQKMEEWNHFPSQVNAVSKESIRQVARDIVDLNRCYTGVIRGKS